MRAEDADESNIFARNYSTNQKLRAADSVGGMDVVEDAFSDSHKRDPSFETKRKMIKGKEVNLKAKK